MDEICDRYKCGKRAVGTGYGAPACYYHESKESYLARTKAARENKENASLSHDEEK